MGKMSRTVKEWANLALEKTGEWFSATVEEWEELSDKEDKLLLVEEDVDKFYERYASKKPDAVFVEDNRNEIDNLIVDYLDEAL